MGKITFLLLLLSFTMPANEPSALLQNNCLSCHREQKIPSELIYRRYLMQYSTNERIEKRVIPFLKNPNKKESIMPKQFFLKFPEKKALDLNTTELEKSVQAYLDYFDIKKKLKVQ
jgi:hypothetical protein